MSTPSLVATTTWNSGDLIGIFLNHYQRLGCERALVMDFNSTDGTREVLLDPRWQGFVDLVPFPGLARLDSSNILLARARTLASAGSWCLFCDPDELLVTTGMAIDRLAAAAARAHTDWMAIPRFNVTASRTLALTDESRLTALDCLTLRVRRGRIRRPERDIQADTLVPSWIFSRIGGKVFVRLSSDVAVGEGDHVVTPRDASGLDAPPGTYLLHYPFRSFSAFREKVELARRGFEANPHLSQQHGWQVRRWIALADANRLRHEYLNQFVADDDIEHLICEGTLEEERSIVEFHREPPTVAFSRSSGR